MSQIKNIERFEAVVGARIKFLRAIGAGSKDLFARLRNEQNVQGTGFNSNFFELESPDDGILMMGSEVILRDLPEKMSLTLRTSVHEKPENCGVQLSLTSDDGEMGVHITHSLTEENTDRWEMSWIGPYAEEFKALMDNKSPGDFAITEAIALGTIKDLAKGHDKHR